jgi:hypothetical protein
VLEDGRPLRLSNREGVHEKREEERGFGGVLHFFPMCKCVQLTPGGQWGEKEPVHLLHSGMVHCIHCGHSKESICEELFRGHHVSGGVPQSPGGHSHALALGLSHHHLHKELVARRAQSWSSEEQEGAEERGGEEM